MSIKSNLVHIRQNISDAAKKAERNSNDIHLIAVSKTQTAEKIREAFSNEQTDFGENYIQEALEKMAALDDLAIRWHFIGHIQRNKCKAIAEHFSFVHTVDSEMIAMRLNQFRHADLMPLQVCIQVNISGEESKSGIKPDDVFSLANKIQSLPKLKLRGLMAIPAASSDIDVQRHYFRQLKNLLSQLQQQGIDVDTLSMGMSNDYVAAIFEGATFLRLGTAIFGKRK